MSKALAQELYQEALNKISNGDFHGAKANLLEIKDHQLSSGSVEYNLAKTYHHTGDIGFAISHLNNAIHLDRFSSTYRTELENLEKNVEKNLGLKMDHPVESAYFLRSYLRPTEAFFFSSLFFVAFLFLQLYKKKKLWKLGSLILSICLLVAAVGSFYGSNVAILKEEAKLKETPLESSRTLRPLSAGARVHVLRKSGDFFEIERSKSFRGWVKAERVFELQ